MSPDYLPFLVTFLGAVVTPLQRATTTTRRLQRYFARCDAAVAAAWLVTGPELIRRVRPRREPHF